MQYFLWYKLGMNITRDIQTLSEFKQNASKLVKQVQETGEPVVLTVNGKPAALLQNLDSYQELIDEREYRETVLALGEALADIENADTWPTHEEAFAKIRERYNIKKRG